jgi:hypothetical protein
VGARIGRKQVPADYSDNDAVPAIYTTSKHLDSNGEREPEAKETHTQES